MELNRRRTLNVTIQSVRIVAGAAAVCMIDAGLRKGEERCAILEAGDVQRWGCRAFLPGHAFQIRGSESLHSVNFRRDYRILADSCTLRGNNQDSICSLDDLADRKTMND